jgi:hypothetical protein
MLLDKRLTMPQLTLQEALERLQLVYLFLMAQRHWAGAFLWPEQAL